MVINHEGQESASREGEQGLRVLTHCDGSAVAPRTLDVWWKEALRHSGGSPQAPRCTSYRSVPVNAVRATPSAVAAWLGHSDSDCARMPSDGRTLALRTYVHADASGVDAPASLFG